jgi:hypothetical protein
MARKLRIVKMKLAGAFRGLAKSKAFKKAAKKIANKKFEKAKSNLVAGFESHPVTREIEGGAEASNTSGTLSHGNLFTFIGFHQEDDPVGVVRTAIREKTRLLSPRTRVQTNRIIVSHTVTVPTLEDLSGATQMPWEGRSWLRAIESGISGFGYYMHKRWEASRSGHGLQVDNKIRGGRYKPTKYYSELIRNFRKEITSK